MSSAANDNEGQVHSFLSPEAVRLDLPISGPAPRMLAYAIDLLLMIVTVILLFILVNMVLPVGATFRNWLARILHQSMHIAKSQNKQMRPMPGFGGSLYAVFIIAEFTVSTCYFILCEMVTGGRSPGKLLVGLRVVRKNGFPIDLRSCVIRNLVRAVDILPSAYLVGITSILLSSSGQRLGDHVAGTIVLRLDRPESASEIPMSESDSDLILTRAQLARIGPREMQLIRGVLRRAPTLDHTRGVELLAEAAEAMRVRLNMADFPIPDRSAFLRGVLNAAERSTRRY